MIKTKAILRQNFHKSRFPERIAIAARKSNILLRTMYPAVTCSSNDTHRYFLDSLGEAFSRESNHKRAEV